MGAGGGGGGGGGRWGCGWEEGIGQVHMSCFLWDPWAHCVIFENGALLMYTLEGVRSVANLITAYEESQ